MPIHLTLDVCGALHRQCPCDDDRDGKEDDCSPDVVSTSDHFSWKQWQTEMILHCDISPEKTKATNQRPGWIVFALCRSYATGSLGWSYSMHRLNISNNHDPTAWCSKKSEIYILGWNTEYKLRAHVRYCLEKEASRGAKSLTLKNAAIAYLRGHYESFALLKFITEQFSTSLKTSRALSRTWLKHYFPKSLSRIAFNNTENDCLCFLNWNYNISRQLDKGICFITITTLSHCWAL